QQLGGDGDEVLHLPPVDREDERLLRGEVPVDGADAHPRRLGDGVERQLLGGGEALGRRGEDALVVAARVRPPRAHRSRRHVVTSRSAHGRYATAGGGRTLPSGYVSATVTPTG